MAWGIAILQEINLLQMIRPRPNVEFFMRRTRNSNLGRPKLSYKDAPNQLTESESSADQKAVLIIINFLANEA